MLDFMDREIVMQFRYEINAFNYPTLAEACKVTALDAHNRIAAAVRA